jgi:hypothetical protein
LGNIWYFDIVSPGNDWSAFWDMSCEDLISKIRKGKAENTVTKWNRKISLRKIPIARESD